MSLGWVAGAVRHTAMVPSTGKKCSLPVCGVVLDNVALVKHIFRRKKNRGSPKTLRVNIFIIHTVLDRKHYQKCGGLNENTLIGSYT